MSHVQTAGIILAAGKGTRMKSDLPKCAFEVCGIPMAELVGRAMREGGVERVVVVIGHRGEVLRGLLGHDYEFAEQTEQLGTGHATMMAAPALEGFEGNVVISAGDTPLVTGDVFRRLIARHEETHAGVTVLAVHVPDPHGYGRIILDDQGDVARVVEHRDATEEERAVDLISTLHYCVDAKLLFEVLPELRNENDQNEYYLPDIVPAILARGRRAALFIAPQWSELQGVNDRWQLAQTAKELRMRILKRHAMAGVTIVDPDSTYIGADVQIDPDVVIQPMSMIVGRTRIGQGSEIGPGVRIDNSLIGRDCRILMSQLERAELGDDVRVGPFANLRPATVCQKGVRVGNFVELKNAQLAPGVKASHLSYLGDATVGADTNIGAGTIFCNYDGFAKHRTTIGNNAFVGSNTTLVAPIRVGDGAVIAAGSVVTKNVPDDALGITRATQENKEEWAQRWRARKRGQAMEHEPTGRTE